MDQLLASKVPGSSWDAPHGFVVPDGEMTLATKT